MGLLLGVRAGSFELTADEMAREPGACLRLASFQPTMPANPPATAPNSRRLGVLT